MRRPSSVAFETAVTMPRPLPRRHSAPSGTASPTAGAAGAAFNLGVLREEQGRTAEAVELYEEARRAAGAAARELPCGAHGS